jgi:hypothetical protein
MQNISDFQALRKILLSSAYRTCLEKPLAFWVLPTDRRLPLAFLTRSLGDLLGTPYEELSKTPGVGGKKMTALVKLLARAADTDPREMPDVAAVAFARFVGEGRKSANKAKNSERDRFDPKEVSEALWSRWRESVILHGLGGEKLGRFTPSLQNVTKVIWETPLAQFAQYTLDELRSMKSYGDKRIRAVLEVFHGLHSILAGLGPQPYLTVRIVPRAIDRIETWVGRTLQTAGIPSDEELLENFVRPLLEQIDIDASPQILALAQSRLGIGVPMCSVRQAARSMSLTRARVYQLLNEINDIMNVRWPLGRHQVHELLLKFEREAAAIEPPPDLSRFQAIVELTYPGNRRGADGALERIADEPEEEPVDAVAV